MRKKSFFQIFCVIQGLSCIFEIISFDLYTTTSIALPSALIGIIASKIYDKQHKMSLTSHITHILEEDTFSFNDTKKQQYEQFLETVSIDIENKTDFITDITRKKVELEQSLVQKKEALEQSLKQNTPQLRKLEKRPDTIELLRKQMKEAQKKLSFEGDQEKRQQLWRLIDHMNLYLKTHDTPKPTVIEDLKKQIAIDNEVLAQVTINYEVLKESLNDGIVIPFMKDNWGNQMEEDTFITSILRYIRFLGDSTSWWNKIKYDIEPASFLPSTIAQLDSAAINILNNIAYFNEDNEKWPLFSRDCANNIRTLRAILVENNINYINSFIFENINQWIYNTEERYFSGQLKTIDNKLKNNPTIQKKIETETSLLSVWGTQNNPYSILSQHSIQDYIKDITNQDDTILAIKKFYTMYEEKINKYKQMYNSLLFHVSYELYPILKYLSYNKFWAERFTSIRMPNTPVLQQFEYNTLDPIFNFLSNPANRDILDSKNHMVYNMYLLKKFHNYYFWTWVVKTFGDRWYEDNIETTIKNALETNEQLKESKKDLSAIKNVHDCTTYITKWKQILTTQKPEDRLPRNLEYYLNLIEHKLKPYPRLNLALIGTNVAAYTAFSLFLIREYLKNLKNKNVTK